MLNYRRVANEAQLHPNHQDLPVYVPALKACLTFGHFITAKVGEEKIVGQLIKRSQGRQNGVIICPYLPLFDDATLQHVASQLLPRRVSDAACTNVVELVSVNKVMEIDANDITGVAFIFLLSDLTDYLFHILGMQDAYLVRYKLSFREDSLVDFNNTNFFPFPDMYPEHRSLWSECVGRNIYSSIDSLRQELWRILCRYGQSQGMFPIGSLKIMVSSYFSHFLVSRLTMGGVVPEEVQLSDQHRRIHTNVV